MQYIIKNALANVNKDVFWIDWITTFQDTFEFSVEGSSELECDILAKSRVMKMQSDADNSALALLYERCPSSANSENVKSAFLATRPRYLDHLYRVNERGEAVNLAEEARKFLRASAQETLKDSLPATPIMKFDPSNAKRVSYFNGKHLIVDIETLGVTPPAPILTIGMVFLDFTKSREGTMTKYYFGVNASECVGDCDEETLAWWGRQDCSVRHEAFNHEPTPNVFKVVASVIEKEAPHYLWGKAPDFDFGHIGAQMKAHNIEVPWKFWQLRDIRTIEGLHLKCESVRKLNPDENNPSFQPHHALFDALTEALQLKSVLFELRRLQELDEDKGESK